MMAILMIFERQIMQHLMKKTLGVALSHLLKKHKCQREINKYEKL